jgi:hypothetical protein
MATNLNIIMKKVFDMEDIIKRVLLPFFTYTEANVVSLVCKDFNTDVKDTVFVDQAPNVVFLEKFITKFPKSSVLNLSNSKLNKKGIDKIYEMTHLKSLIFNHTNLQPIGLDFSKLSFLTKLEAKCCYGITDEVISKLVNLVELDISQCYDLCTDSPVTGSCFKHLSKLKKLTITNILAIKNESFDYLSKLEELEVATAHYDEKKPSDFSITNESIKKLKSIKILNLCGQNHLTDDALSNFTQIEDLTINNCNLITDDGISNLKGIKKLAIGGCYRITGSGFESIKGIEVLYANETNLLPSNFCHLKGIKILYIGNCRKITDEVFQYLIGVQKLEISGNNKITGKNIADIKGIKSLNISNCKNIEIDNILMLEGLEQIKLDSHCVNHMKADFINPLKEFVKVVKVFKEIQEDGYTTYGYVTI